MQQTVYLFVNGILTFPGESNNWTGRAVTATHLKTEARAEKIEYFSSVFSRAFFNRERARKLARTLEFYHGWQIVLVGHSNGCDVILDAMQEMYWPQVKHLHLLSAACDADFERNGLNDLGTHVENLTVWIGMADWALELAETPLGKWLGYGSLGRTGPRNSKRSCEIIRKPWGHNDWFSDINFQGTMNRIWI